MSVTIYGPPASRAGRILWLMRELGAEWRVVPLDMFKGELQTPDFLALNPMGQAPAIKDEDFALAESLAINLYLAKKFGGPLAPRDLREDARATQWSMWALTACEPHFLPLIAHRTALPPEHRKPAIAAQAEAALQRPVRAFNAHLAAHGNYIMGDRFTVADLNVAATFAPAIAAGLDLSGAPQMREWADSVYARPAAAGMLEPVVFPPPIVEHFLSQAH